MRRVGAHRAAAIVAVATLVCGAGVAVAAVTGQDKPLDNQLIGRQGDGSVLTSQNQFVSSAGTSIEQTGRPMAMAVRPDGQTAVDLTKSGDGLFTVVDLATKQVVQQYTPPAGVGSNDIGRGGLLYSPDGATLWAAQTRGLLRFDVATDGTLSNPVAIPLPGVDGRRPLPVGLAWAPDGQHILVVLNGNNTLGVLDPQTNQLVQQIAVGNAPAAVSEVDVTAGT